MSLCSLRPLLIVALIAGSAALTGCSRKTPCVKLSVAICEGAERSTCQAFVDGEMAADGERLAGDQKQAACQLVLDDPQTVAAMRRAFIERKGE